MFILPLALCAKIIRISILNRQQETKVSHPYITAGEIQGFYITVLSFKNIQVYNIYIIIIIIIIILLYIYILLLLLLLFTANEFSLGGRSPYTRNKCKK